MEHISTLDLLPVGQNAVVASLSAPPKQAQRMMELGFAPGRHVAALLESPWGDPVAYAVCGAVIALRKNDAKHILIQI